LANPSSYAASPRACAPGEFPETPPQSRHGCGSPVAAQRNAAVIYLKTKEFDARSEPAATDSPRTMNPAIHNRALFDARKSTNHAAL